VTPLYLLMLTNGDPADPAVLVGDGVDRDVGDRFANRAGGRWRIVSVSQPSPQLTAEDFAGVWVVEPLD
jgi:hypothetical protein